MTMADDARFMAAALAFARRGLGVTSPNPAVGSLVVKNGIVVSRGATRPGGRPHAETVALAAAGEAARGATLYVTLEPCSHHGVTGPCAHAIVAAGISRVVSAIEDPDPRVAGRGHAILREAGVEVVVGVGAEQAKRANLGHILRVTQGRPMVTLKLAETADGYSAAASPHDPRLTITSQAANNRVQILRAMHDAIMIGAGTALGDDPLLTVRLPGVERAPLRIVLDTQLRLPLRSRLVATAKEWPLLVVAGEGASAPARKALEDAGVRVEIAPRAQGGGLDLAAALGLLASIGLTRIFSEGGPHVGAALVTSGLADDVILIRGAKPLGRAGLPSLDAGAQALLADASLYRIAGEAPLGPDLLRHYERVC